MVRVGGVGGKYDSDSAKLSVPAAASRASVRASRRSCSSNSEKSTTAPTPASARRWTPSTVLDRGDADATSGLRKVQAQVAGRQFHQRSLRASGWKCSGPREAISS